MASTNDDIYLQSKLFIDSTHMDTNISKLYQSQRVYDFLKAGLRSHFKK